MVILICSSFLFRELHCSFLKTSLSFGLFVVLVLSLMGGLNEIDSLGVVSKEYPIELSVPRGI